MGMGLKITILSYGGVESSLFIEDVIIITSKLPLFIHCCCTQRLIAPCINLMRHHEPLLLLLVPHLLLPLILTFHKLQIQHQLLISFLLPLPVPAALQPPINLALLPTISRNHADVGDVLRNLYSLLLILWTSGFIDFANFLKKFRGWIADVG